MADSDSDALEGELFSMQEVYAHSLRRHMVDYYNEMEATMRNPNITDGMREQQAAEIDEKYVLLFTADINPDAS